MMAGMTDPKMRSEKPSGDFPIALVSTAPPLERRAISPSISLGWRSLGSLSNLITHGKNRLGHFEVVGAVDFIPSECVAGSGHEAKAAPLDQVRKELLGIGFDSTTCDEVVKITHALLGLANEEQLLGHPVAGASWEGFAIETLIAAAPTGTTANFYRTAAGAEIDLLLTLPGRRPWAIEIKRSLSPTLEKGFYLACEDLEPEQRLVLYPGEVSFPLKNDVTALSISSAARMLQDVR